jgi:hypothetical protein
MKTFTLSVLTLLYSVCALAQSQQPGTFQDLINVDTKSPDAAALGKFGNIPVNYSTGATSLSIPVFDINIGKIRLPISLDYHTGGIRVDETSSSVGLGWALNGIGLVSRNVVNIPDEDGAGGYLSSPPPDSLYNDWSHGGGQYGQSVDDYYAQWLNQFREGAAEADPDIYSYNINGQGGKFIIKRDLTIMQIPHSNNQIAQVSGGGFKIIDANGVIYIFDQKEHVEQPTPDLTRFYVGTWRLSKMIDPGLADTVFFSYDAACGPATDKLYSYTYNLITNSDCASKAAQGEQFHISTTIHEDGLFPSQISWRGGMIQFSNACGRSDRASDKRLDHISVYAIVNGGQRLIKTVQLYQSYFYSHVVTGNYTPTDERNYRLRLDSVSMLPTSGSLQPQTWRMTYNNGNMAPRESAAQDIWGFNNGKFNNSSLIPQQTVVYNSVNYAIENNNSRDPDASAMLACTISSIQYPTGGKSVFEFEPHQWNTYNNYTTPQSTPCIANSINQTSSQINWTPDPQGSSYNITYAFSAYNVAGMNNQRPNITITDVTNPSSPVQVVFLSSNITASLPLNNYQNPTPWYPTLGHSYLIVANVYNITTVNVSAQININWTRTYTNVPETKFGGGLRVRSVTSYDLDGTLVGKDLYKYGASEDGIGQLLTPANYLQVTSKQVSYACAMFGAAGSDPGSGGSCMNEYGSGLTIYANPVFPATQFSGSPILYPSVTKYPLDAQGYPTNGKSVFTYSIYDDQPAFASTNYQKIGVLMILNEWKNGFLGSQSDYKYDPATSSYILVKQTSNNFQAARGETYNGIKVENSYTWLQDDCHLNSMLNATSEYFIAQVPTNTGAMLLQSTAVTTYGTNGTPLTVTENYAYNDVTHLFPTSKSTVDSKNITDLTNLKYPHDLASGGNVYAEMVGKNIISPVVQSQRMYNGVQADLHNLIFQDWSGTGNLLLPSSVAEQVRSNPTETRILFNQYDKYGNILQQQKANDLYQSYVWDYNSVYPIAKCSNAAVTAIAATSFEADGKGGWSIPSAVRETSAITGRQCYNLSHGACTVSGLSSSVTYHLTYWSKGGAYSVTGSNTVLHGKTVNGWTYYEHWLTGASTVSVSGSAQIDELRIYPASAEMTTYTYDPLIGMTSQCDQANVITYYEYDEMGRLKDVKDQDGNVIKTYDYHYHTN